MTRLADRLAWLVLLAAVAYIGAHVYMDCLAGVQTFEDGSAVLTLPPVVVTVPAFDSPGDAIRIELR